MRRDFGALATSNTEKNADLRLISRQKSRLCSKRKRSNSSALSEPAAKRWGCFLHVSRLYLFLMRSFVNRVADGLEMLKSEGWLNVTTSPLEFLGKCATASHPVSSRRGERESCIDLFLQVLGPETLQVIAARISARKQPSDGDRARLITDKVVARFLGVHFLRSSGDQPTTSSDVYRDFKCGDAIGHNLYRYIIALISRFEPHDLVAIETSLRQGFQACWSIGLHRTIDELLFSYTPHELTVCMPRKPHPNGHLFYLMCTRSEGSVERSFPFCYDFCGKYSSKSLSAVNAALQLAVQNAPKRPEERPVHVVDSAFGTADFCHAMRKQGLLYMAAVSENKLGAMQHYACVNLPQGSHRLYANSDAEVLTVCHGEVTDANTNNTVASIMYSRTNAYKTSGPPQCTCRRGGTREDAELMRKNFSDEMLKHLCHNTSKPLGTFQMCSSFMKSL